MAFIEDLDAKEFSSALQKHWRYPVHDLQGLIFFGNLEYDIQEKPDAYN